MRKNQRQRLCISLCERRGPISEVPVVPGPDIPPVIAREQGEPPGGWLNVFPDEESIDKDKGVIFVRPFRPKVHKAEECAGIASEKQPLVTGPSNLEARPRKAGSQTGLEGLLANPNEQYF